MVFTDEPQSTNCRSGLSCQRGFEVNNRRVTVLYVINIFENDTKEKVKGIIPKFILRNH